MTFQTLMMLLGGLFLILAGANYLVEGASDIARRSGLSEFVIGLTIVAIGTSAPEMVVSFTSSILGNSDIAIGNIVGSNIFNTMLILGLSAIILPIGITPHNIKWDIPMNLIASILLIFFGLNYTIFGTGSNQISRLDGAIMLAVFAGYMAISFCSSHETDQENTSTEARRPVWLSIIMVLASIAALIFGGRLFVDSGIEIARACHVPEAFIAITLMAGGTSLPELVTCIVAAAKKRGSLALGNILGSNIFNILLIVGGSALIRPIQPSGISSIDFGVMLLSAVFILAGAYMFEKNKLGRVEGVILTLMWAAYMAWLIIKL